MTPDGRIVAFSWTYDSKKHKYLNIHRRISRDNGKTWSHLEDLGFADQPSHPAILQDGRVVLAWVDRFGSQTIRVRMAPAIDRPYDENTEIILHTQKIEKSAIKSTGELLGDMSLWNFGLPYCEAVSDDEAMIMYYAGTEMKMDIHWAKLQLDT